MKTDMRNTAIQYMEGQSLIRMPDRPAMRNVNKTRNKITAANAQLKTKHPNFPSSDQFGYAAAIMKTTQHITIHNKILYVNDNKLEDAWKFEYPTRPAT